MTDNEFKKIIAAEMEGIAKDLAVAGDFDDIGKKFKSLSDTVKNPSSRNYSNNVSKGLSDLGKSFSKIKKSSCDDPECCGCECDSDGCDCEQDPCVCDEDDFGYCEKCEDVCPDCGQDPCVCEDATCQNCGNEFDDDICPGCGQDPCVCDDNDAICPECKHNPCICEEDDCVGIDCDDDRFDKYLGDDECCEDCDDNDCCEDDDDDCCEDDDDDMTAIAEALMQIANQLAGGKDLDETGSFFE